jgi:hypothetical protein
MNAGTGPKKTDDLGGKAKAHQRYYVTDPSGAKNKDGSTKKIIVPGATTVLGVMGKSSLTGWANRLGLEGIDSNKYRDEMADIGSCAHYLVECQLKGETPDLQHFTAYQIKRAQHAFANWESWRKGKRIEPELIEGRLVSEKYRYGGTVDLYGLVDGERTLIDFKTSENIYLEHRVQTTSYVRLLIENGRPVRKAIVIRLGRGIDDTLEVHYLGQEILPLYWKLFEHCLDIYELQKAIKKGEAAA